MNITLEAVNKSYKWAYKVGLVLAGAVILLHYGHMPTLIPYLADVIRIILILYGFVFPLALYKVYANIPDKAPLDEFWDLLTKVFLLFLYYVILNSMTHNIVTGTF